MGDEKHFKLRDDLKITFNGATLYRIEALRNISIHGVKAGAIGGYVEKEDNLSGNAWVFGDAKVYGEANVSGYAKVFGDAQVFGNAKVHGDAFVSCDVIKSPGDCISITNAGYNITITPKFIRIGCQFHTKEAWWRFTDKEILAMDGRDGLKWWNKWKLVFMAICEGNEKGD